ncbi:phage holin family protein [uncultured Erythrobacter sp.]|uniref:phage holin family protein n=1 Tax=uncultured Erythrobacter sp. TaxID=263913 RepID=UPI00261238C3|nr:phage holin family protein [uncultured Erythrobacter sp.]
MLEGKGPEGSQDETADPLAPIPPEKQDDSADTSPTFDESLVEELAALYDDGKTYAEAELAFQKGRAALAGKSIGVALGLVIVAIILLHIAFLALAVGLVIALAPLVTIWGAIAIVVGGILLLVGLLGFGAYSKGKLLGALFSSPSEDKAK